MCIHEGVCQCVCIPGLDVERERVCVYVCVLQGEIVYTCVRSVPGNVWMHAWGEGRMHSGAAVSAR